MAIMLLAGGTIYAANDKNVNDVPSSLDGDEISYDMRTGVITAQGNVLMTHGNAKIAGNAAEFNMKTKAGSIQGNVIAIQDDMKMTAESCVSDGEHIVAKGDSVHAVKGDKSYTGPQVDYFQSKHYILMEYGGVIASKAGDTFTADRMEGWTDTNNAKGTGNAHLVSPTRKLEAAGDNVDYYGKEAKTGEPAKAYLTGNAWAVQENNTLRSNRLVVYLADEGETKAKVAE